MISPSHRGTLSRRAFLYGAGAAALAQGTGGKGQTFASEIRRYADPATEFPVLRLTSPDHASYLTAPYSRGMAGRNTLYFTSDRSGGLDLFRMDVRSGSFRQLTAGAHIDPGSVAVLANERAVVYFDGSVLRLLAGSSLKEREIYTLPPEVERPAGSGVSTDGTQVFFVEKQAERYRIRAVAIDRGKAATVIESGEPLRAPIPRPGHPSILYRAGNSLKLIHVDGTGDQRLALAPGEALAPSWSPDGSSLLYINVAPDRGQLNTIRELEIEAARNQLISKTSQFISFGTNSNATVFVGASGSKASPHVLILIRSVKRELTLCEHRATNPSFVNPIFAPNSQRILFASDQHGKPAIYSMTVERFVEETES